MPWLNGFSLSSVSYTSFVMKTIFQPRSHSPAAPYREPSIRPACGILWSSRWNYAVPRLVKVWIVKCSPRTDSESFSSSREQACVNTGQDKVLIYPRVWRTRISWITRFQAYLKCLLFQEGLTVKRKRRCKKFPRCNVWTGLAEEGGLQLRAQV